MPHPNHRPRPRPPRAFTLVEILVVVVILGVLAAIVLPNFTDATGKARDAAFKSNLRDLAGAASLYYQKYGALPEQAAGVAVPAVLLTEAGRRADYPLRTPLGGYWHIGHIPGQGWGVGVWWSTAEGDDLTRRCEAVDAAIDDGDQNTGRFVCDAGNSRYYWIVE